MRSILLASIVLTLLAPAGRADDATDIVDKAVRAMATSDLRLNRLATAVRVERGSFFPPSGEMPCERTVSISPPDRVRYDATITIGRERQSMVMALNGLLSWQKAGGKIEDLSLGQSDIMKNGDIDSWALTTLLPLRQRGIKLKALSKAADDKPAVGVNVARSDRPDAQVYFDAKTGLPAKVAVKTRYGDLEVSRVVDLAEFKDFDGIKLPTRITVSENGRKIEEWTVQNYRFPDKLDEKLFAKPK
jgi:hypothetical protein